MHENIYGTLKDTLKKKDIQNFSNVYPRSKSVGPAAGRSVSIIRGPSDPGSPLRDDDKNVITSPYQSPYFKMFSSKMSSPYKSPKHH